MFIPAIHCRVVCSFMFNPAIYCRDSGAPISPTAGFKPGGGRVVTVAVPGIKMPG